jgi:hypothetical protein
MSDRRFAAFGLLLLVDMVLATVMLVTDKNLQTNFGAQSPYYLHWYGVLAMAVIDLVVGGVVLAAAFPSVQRRMSPTVRRRGAMAALLWTVLAILASVGIVSAYQQVGFGSMSQFAQYLFGVTPYPDALSYIPGLYDALLVTYVLTAVAGALAVGRRTSPTPNAATS